MYGSPHESVLVAVVVSACGRVWPSIAIGSRGCMHALGRGVHACVQPHGTTPATQRLVLHTLLCGQAPKKAFHDKASMATSLT